MNDGEDETRDQTPEDVERLTPPLPTFAAGDPVPGLASWVLERKLGGGGFGEVWLARHAWDAEQKPRAVKFCTDPVAKRRLVTHEKNVVLRVMRYAGNHPNVVPLLDCNPDGDIPWLMYEYVEGGTLAASIEGWRELPMSRRLGKAVRVLHTLSGALATFHRLAPPIVHRDLKPQNVLMAGGAVPRVTDFGIGGVAVPQRVPGATGTVTAYSARVPSELHAAGTRAYAPPEQQFGSAPDPRDDVYALGVIAYQMMLADTDAVPGTDANLELRALRVPRALIALIVQSVAINADRRPKDAGEWEAALTAVLTKAQHQSRSEDSDVVPPPLPARPAEPTGRRWSPGLQPPAPGTAPARERVSARPVREQTESPRKPGEAVVFPLPLGQKMVFCWVPPGRAQLGSPLAEQNAVADCVGRRDEWLAAESELHRRVYTSKGFWLGKYPVTQAQWYAVTGKTPSHFQAGSGGGEAVRGLDTTRFPVERVSWDMICEKGGFLDRLNALDGQEAVFGRAVAFALPHEDAWEYACRGGLGNERAFYFGQTLSGVQANVDGRHPFGAAMTKPLFGLLSSRGEGPFVGRPTTVGAYADAFPHPWGLCDMHGNVLEWCGNADGAARVLRGGSWRHAAFECRSASRFSLAPTKRDKFIGFRIFVFGL